MIAMAFAALSLLLLACVADASWQNPSNGAAQTSRDLDLSPSMFAPGGRLFSVERMAQVAIDKDDVSNNLVAALLCRDGIVVISSCLESPYLPRNLTVSNQTDETVQFLQLSKPSTGVPTPPLLRLSTNVWAVTAGNIIDSQLVRLRLHKLAEVAREQGLGDRADVLARQLADNFQLMTQSEGNGRVLAAHAVIFTDKEIWKVDPTGQFWNCAAAVIGRDSWTAENNLLSRLQLKRDPREELNSLPQESALKFAKDVVAETLMDSAKESDKEKPLVPIPLTGLAVSKQTTSWC